MGMLFSLYETRALIKDYRSLPAPISIGANFQLIYQTIKTVRRNTFEFKRGRWGDCLEATLVFEGERKFSIYWTSDLASITEYEFEKLNVVFKV